MNCDYLEKISQLIDGNLDASDEQIVRQHLAVCEECRQAEQNFLALRQTLRAVELKRDSSAERKVLQTILQSKNEQPSKQITERKTPFFQPIRVAFATSVLLIFSLAGVFLYNRLPQKSWEVVNLEGNTVIGKTKIEKNGQLKIGDWLETDSVSKAKIAVANIGSVEVEPETRISLVTTNPQEHRLEMERGAIKAVINAPPKLFFVNTPSATVIDYGCEYTLTVNDEGESVLHVTNGWVSLFLNGRESLVPASAYAKSRRGIGPGTPFFEDASGKFSDALTRFDFENGGSTALDVILAESRQRDAMSLWYLLEKTGENERLRVFEKLSEFVALPTDATRQGVLALDRKMLESWKETIDVTSVGESYNASQQTPNRSLISVGEMSEPRAAHTATLLNNGKVLIAGGFRKDGEGLATAEIFDPQTNKFSPVEKMQTPRFAHTATLLANGKVLIVGGTNANGLPNQTAEIFDPTTMTFSPTTNLNFARSNHQATNLADGKILITGGINAEKTALAEAEIYDVQNGIFTVIGKQIAPRAFHTATLLKNGNVLLTGGNNGNVSQESVLDTAEIFQASANKFFAVSNLTEKRYSHSADLLADGKVLITGGSSGNEWKKRLSSAEIFDPEKNNSTKIDGMIFQRFNHQSATVTLKNGQILLAGAAARLEKFDATANKFSSVLGNVGTGRINSTATLLNNGSVLIIGGYNLGFPPTTNGWLYVP